MIAFFTSVVVAASIAVFALIAVDKQSPFSTQTAILASVVSLLAGIAVGSIFFEVEEHIPISGRSRFPLTGWFRQVLAGAGCGFLTPAVFVGGFRIVNLLIENTSWEKFKGLLLIVYGISGVLFLPVIFWLAAAYVLNRKR